MTGERTRLDAALVARGLAESRQKAQALVMAGLVSVGGVVAEKPGQRIPAESHIEVKGPAIPYVSRGGLKLEAALREFAVPVNGACALDVGSSTGGFVDCLLQHGARKVYAVDVGYGQLHHKLRQDPRVILLERTNARYLSSDMILEKPTVVTMDVSFISITKIVPAVTHACDTPFHLVALVKPQFEAGRGQVPGGVVKSEETHRQVLESVSSFLKAEGFRCLGLMPSPIRGPEGNIEFLLYAVHSPGDGAGLTSKEIDEAVARAHSSACGPPRS
ncbi:MAG: TlyA family RNA methyltransferase [Bacillota bacterium]|nr:TlyA family RNA methyltransferase [Bacillota bacterium]